LRRTSPVSLRHGSCKFESSADTMVVAGTFSYAKVVGKKSSNSGNDEPWSSDAVLELASMTKLVTTIAVLQLVEKGRVTLDEDVSSWIPEFAAQDILIGFSGDGQPQFKKRQNPVTLRLLLTHTAGAGYTFIDPSLGQYRTSIQKRHILDGATVNARFDHPLLYEPGEGWAYSSSVDRVGQIVEAISGENLEEYFKKNIFEPLGISSGTFWPGRKPELEARRVPMAFRDEKTGGTIEKPDEISFNTTNTECFGGQGLCISLDDYLKILHSLLVDDEVVLRRETTALMFQPQLTPPSKAKLLEVMEDPAWAVGDFPITREYDWGLGGILVDGDSHAFRKRGTLIWNGAANLFWVSN
jgi:CubicO group peptidase (beta-lactamase class C family)